MKYVGDESEEATEINETHPLTKMKSKLSDYFADVCKERSKKSKLERVVTEVNRYKSEECIEIDEKPLMWWTMREDQYPIMANLARRYFSISATSVRSNILSSWKYFK